MSCSDSIFYWEKINEQRKKRANELDDDYEYKDEKNEKIINE